MTCRIETSGMANVFENQFKNKKVLLDGKSFQLLLTASGKTVNALTTFYIIWLESGLSNKFVNWRGELKKLPTDLKLRICVSPLLESFRYPGFPCKIRAFVFFYSADADYRF